MAIYDDDIFVEGEFYSSEQIGERNALETYKEGDELSLIYIPTKEITYKNTNGFGAYVCENNDDEDNPPTFIVSGSFSRSLDLGHTYKSKGTVTLRNGSFQFRIKNIEKIVPETKHGVLSFLRSLSGMQYRADVIYDRFGNNSLNIIKTNPDEILKLVSGSYPEQVYSWKKEIEECKNGYGLLSDLIALGMKPTQAKKVFDQYGEEAILKIQQDPYFLIGKIPGYGFKKCDAIGKELGIKPNDLERLMTGILYTLQTLMINGSTCIDLNTVIENCVRELSVRMTHREMVDAMKQKKPMYSYRYGPTTYQIPLEKIKSDYVLYTSSYSAVSKADARTIVYDIKEEEVEQALKALQLANKIIIEDGNVFIRKYYDEELNIAYYIQQIERNKKPIDKNTVNLLVDKFCSKNNIVLEDRQREAVVNVCSNHGGANIINGAAGCGKTFCIKVALNVLEQIYNQSRRTLSSVIVAPTGKAARVAYNATGIESYTIHKLLQYKPNEGFYYNARNKLPYDCIVIDECSMLDTNLAHSLFSAIHFDTKVIMMGDTNQLPSIGAGNVFHDLIESAYITVTTLDVIKRQGVDSGIVENARHIINGEPITTLGNPADSLVVAAISDEDYIARIKKYCDKALRHVGIDDLQILSPMKRGITGTNYLNYILQETYNQNKSDMQFLKGQFDVKIGDEVQNLRLYFKTGDKVINTRNDYKAVWYHVKNGVLYRDDSRSGITNGEVGIIVKMIESRDGDGNLNQKMVVRFEDKYIIYENDFNDLELAYAITIHRSQGSEWKAIMVVLNPSHKNMIDRNLFYTGITRSKQLSIVVSDKETIKYGVGNTKSVNRKTGLINRMNELISNPFEVGEITDMID